MWTIVYHCYGEYEIGYQYALKRDCIEALELETGSDIATYRECGFYATNLGHAIVKTSELHLYGWI